MMIFVMIVTFLRANAIKKPGTKTGLPGMMHSLNS